MIKDYTKYELTGREKRIFYFAGYGTVFFVVYLFYHSILLSAVSGCLGVLFAASCGKTACRKKDESNDCTVQGSALFLVGISCGRTANGRALVEAGAESSCNV